MKKNSAALVMINLLVATSSVFSADNNDETKSPWTSSIELGFIRTTGNTETQTTAAKANVVYEVDKWRHTGHAESYGSQAKNQTTGETETSAERYDMSGKSDYKITERDYTYGIVKLQKDRFSGFEYNHVVSLGYGRKAIKQENMELDLEIGPGQKFFKVDGGENETEAILRLAANYWWKITDSSKFSQSLTSDIGETFTTNVSITGVQANINKTLALKFTYTIRNKSEVPEGSKNTDTEAGMTLVYTF
ncbi:hypothetical protein MNBD_GAMMA06-1376 [hydrothermal vent metagenome]|uniref:DUF481 domain-containing protein n=1 Tax=hydrothermal vent metagenome TaxID=652676 RepID=A0A3B0WI51_9ZZZZ